MYIKNTIIFTILIINVINCDNLKYGKQLLISSLESLPKDFEESMTTIEDVCPGKSQAFLNASLTVKACIEEIKLEDQTLCEVADKILTDCTNPLIEVTESCLPNEIKQIVPIGFESLKSLSQLICKMDVEHILELFNPCVQKLNVCMGPFGKLMESDQSELTQESFCKAATEAKECMEKENICENEITTDAVMSTFSASAAVCFVDEECCEDEE